MPSFSADSKDSKVDKSKTESNIQEQPGNARATQAALSRAVAMIQAKAPTQLPQTTAPSIPKFYNASAVNPTKIATQEEKRKLLWGDTKKVFQLLLIEFSFLYLPLFVCNLGKVIEFNCQSMD